MTNLSSQRLLLTRKRLLLSAAALLYCIVFILAYIFNTATNYSAWYGIVSTPGLGLLAMAIALAIIPSFIIPMTAQKPSTIVKWFLYVMVFVPSCIVPMFTLHIPPIYLPFFFATLLLAFLLLLLPGYLFPRLRIRFQGFSPRWFATGMLICTGIVVGAIVSVFGFHFILPSFTDVYSVRSEYSDTLQEENHRLSYLVRWSLYIIGPYWFILGLTRKNLVWLSLGIVVQLLIYSIAGFKTSILLIGLITGIAITLVNGGKYFGFWVIGGAIAAIIGALSFEFVTGNDILSSLVVRRALVTPGLLSGYYFEFFSSHPFAFLANNKYFGAPFRLLGVEYPYVSTVPYVIGAYYFGREAMSANANLWVEAFANFGYVGILAYSFFLGIVLHIYDSIAYQRNYWLGRLMILGPTIALTNSGLLAVMLGHGMLLIIVLLYLSPSTPTAHHSKMYFPPVPTKMPILQQ